MYLYILFLSNEWFTIIISNMQGINFPFIFEFYVIFNYVQPWNG